MAKIEDYAIIGNCETAALVSRDGSVDWLCWPHFDSRACFAQLVGRPENGCWKIKPISSYSVSRRYREDTLILETEFRTSQGSFRLIDFMPIHSPHPRLIRIMEGLSGKLDLEMDLVIRFDYGSIVPWMNRLESGGKLAVGGPDSILFQSSMKTYGENLHTKSQFSIQAGEKHWSCLTWYPSHLFHDATVDVFSAFKETENYWRDWISKSTYEGEFKNAVNRSLLTLKALTFAPTGGIVAAPTTSLPEQIGGHRNWDYRFCWLRDSTFTLYSLITTGFLKEAEDWRQWLVRTIAGTPSQVNIMYGIRGERRLDEIELPWLVGFENSKPVRIGNAAFQQRQLDIFGELMDTLQLARRSGLSNFGAAWSIQKEMIRFVIDSWRLPDEGIWEVRGGKQHFTHSKAMAWVALDRAIKAVEHFGLDGNINLWKQNRDQIKKDILTHAYNPKLGCLTQAYHSQQMDSSLLQLPILGFLPANDPIMAATVKRIETELMDQGLLHRYRTEKNTDGINESEGKFLACTFWLADYYVLSGDILKAQKIFRKLVRLTNDVGLLSEEYDTKQNRMIGNFPQALSHIALINSAVNLSCIKGSARHRSDQTSDALFAEKADAKKGKA